MATPVKVLVVGSGTLGSSVLHGLAANKAFEVSLLAREASATDAAKAAKFEKLRAAGVHVVHGDASEALEVLAPKLAPFHTVISTVSVPLKTTDLALLEAAKKAGVKRFVPSSWGFDVRRVGRGSAVSLLDDKLDVEDAVAASGLDYLFFYTGLFTEYLFSPFFGVDVANSTVTAQVSFDTTVWHTSLQDIGTLVAAALLDPALTKQVVHIGSETVSFEQVAQALEKAGKKIERKITPKGGNQEHFNDPNFLTSLSARFLDVASTPDITIDVATQAWNKKALPDAALVTIEAYAAKLA